MQIVGEAGRDEEGDQLRTGYEKEIKVDQKYIKPWYELVFSVMLL